MKKGCRRALIVCIVLLALCAVGTGLILRKFKRASTFEPKTIASIHRGILTAPAPENYIPLSGMDLPGYRTVEYRVGPDDQSVTITFIEIAGKRSRQEGAREKLRENAERRQPVGATLSPMPQEMVTIRGKPVRVSVLEATATPDHPPFRQWSGVTESDQGLVLFMINGHPASWQPESFKSLIQTIR